MKIKLNQPILNIEGKNFLRDEQIIDPKNKEKIRMILIKVPLTLKDVIVNSLLAPRPNEKAELKLRRSKLAEEIYKENEIDLIAEKIVLIKEMIDFYYQTPFIVYDTYKLLEGEVIRDEIKDIDNIIDVSSLIK